MRFWAILRTSPTVRVLWHAVLCIVCLAGAAGAAWTHHLWLLLFDGGAAAVSALDWQRASTRRKRGHSS